MHPNNCLNCKHSSYMISFPKDGIRCDIGIDKINTPRWYTSLYNSQMDFVMNMGCA